MPCNAIDRNAYELEASRKRKRKSEKFEDIQRQHHHHQQQETCLSTNAAATTLAPTPTTTPTSIGFTNEAFSSTPKKLIARRRILPKLQPANNFIARHNLEEKSIAALVHEKTNAANPFEVVRKPPKKKKCESKIVEACFENPALNLEMPEKQFNPYEVHRESLRPLSQCFVNEALNIKGQDVPASRNPFEIKRSTQTSELAANPDGVENKAMEEVCPSKLKIGLPFTPTVGCRIDFKDISLSELTPTKLLADKLVFSPAPPKRSLGAISEETTMDIGRELDLYQLELENSINEAKLRRKAGIPDALPKTKENSLSVVTEVLEETIEVTQKITQTCTNQSGEIVSRDEQVVEMRECIGISNVMAPLALEEDTTEAQAVAETVAEELQANAVILEDDDVDGLCPNNDVEYASAESDLEDDHEDDREVDFKAPAPFVRAYRRPAIAPKAESKESLDSQPSGDGVDAKKASVKSLIRSSIRKLMHPGGESASKPEDQPDTEKHHNFMHTIRHSLRRKPSGKQLLIEDDETLPIQEISIIDSSERTMKFKSSEPQTEYVRIEQLTNERKHTLRNSIRRSTRDLMKSVFHKKQEEYELCK